MDFKVFLIMMVSIISLANANLEDPDIDSNEVTNVRYENHFNLSESEVILICSVISAGIFLVVVIFGLIVFCGEMDEEKEKLKPFKSTSPAKLNREFVEIEMEERSHLSNSKVKKITPNIISLPVHSERIPFRPDRKSGDGMFIIRKSMDEVSFKTIVEEDEHQLDDFHSLRC